MSTVPPAAGDARAPSSATGTESGTVREATSQPACALCGAADINLVRAAAAGWRRVLERLTCAYCAGRFPAWMCKQF
jgi:hypothetical protein